MNFINQPGENQSPEINTSTKKPKKGYEELNRALTIASIALLSRLHIADCLASTEGKWDCNAPDTREKRYLEAIIDFLESQGVIKRIWEKRSTKKIGKNKDTDTPIIQKIQSTEEGSKHLQNGEIIEGVTELFGDITTLLKEALGWEEASQKDYRIDPDTAYMSEALVPAAITFLHEVQTRDGKNAGEALIAGETLEQHELITHGIRENVTHLLQALVNKELLQRRENGYQATEKGKAVLALGGYAELIMSYFPMFQSLTELLRGEKEYGLTGDINRDAKLNAHASNGILNVRVAPYIVNTVLAGLIDSEDKDLVKRLLRTDAHLDYGSGGGDMLMQAGQEVNSLFGIDINPATNAAAQELLDKEGLTSNTHLVTGSITNRDALQNVKDEMERRETEYPVATINFILHDIGPALASSFLAKHAEVFGDTPLIITETLRMPQAVINTHPDYQAASFQFMHTASGQHLYTEEELKQLLESCGYKIIHQKTHSSMPGVEEGERHDTIVTWIARYVGKEEVTSQ